MKRFVAVVCLILFVLFFVCVGFVPAQEIKLPPTLKGVPGQWIVVAPESVDGGLPRWRSSDGLAEVDLSALFPPDLLKQARGRVFTAARPGTYYVEAWNAKGDVASAISRCVVTVIDPAAPMPKDPPADPPKDPAPAPATKLYFLVVRPDGPASPSLVAVLGLPAWDRLRATGHQFRDVTLSEAKASGAKVDRAVPCVVVLRPRAGSLPYEQLRIVDMPTTDAEVDGLPAKGVGQ